MIEWRPIPGFHPYEASNDGRVRGKRGELKSHVCRNGYHNVWLYPNGWKEKRYCKGVHQCVLLAFIGQPTEGTETLHGDHNKGNNKLENLSYGTKSRNGKDKREVHRCGGQKLTPEEVKRLRSTRGSNKIVAEQFGVSASLVSMIRNRRRWNP